jgi:hypothetical protein
MTFERGLPTESEPAWPAVQSRRTRIDSLISYFLTKLQDDNGGEENLGEFN